MTVKTLKVYYCDVQGCSATTTVEPGRGVPEGWVLKSTLKQHRCPEHLLVPCSMCGRKIRPPRAPASEYPGTVLPHTLDLENPLCRVCHYGRKPVESVSERDVRFIRRLVETRLDDPDDRLLVLDQLGLLGSD